MCYFCYMYFEQNISGPIFISDAPDVVISSANSDSIRVTINVDGASWDIDLSPSALGTAYKTVLKLKDVLCSVAVNPDYLSEDSFMAPKISITADNGVESPISMEFQALYGNADGKSPAELKRHWLSWREQISVTMRGAREFLTFASGLKLLGWSSGRYSAKAKLFIYGSEPVETTISEGALEDDIKYFKLDYSPSRLCESAGADISKLMAIDCYFSLSGKDSGGDTAHLASFPLRLILAGSNDSRMKEFIFCNSLGVEDRVVSFGVGTRSVDGESSVFTSNGLSHELDNSGIESFQVQSGNISSARGAALWSDFLKASGRYLVSEGKATEIIVEEWSTDITEGELSSVSFKYHLSRTDGGRWFEDSDSLGNYDPLEKFGALSIAGPDVATPPTEDLFFLKTRLDEFPLAELGDDFLFLIQSKTSYSWNSASLKSLKGWLLENVSIEALQLWCGPWDDYSEAVSKYALSAGAGKELLDIIYKMDSVLQSGINAIKALVPSSASTENQLADKAFVNSSIASNTATFRGTFETVVNLPTRNVKTNDYAFVIAESNGNPEYQRYKYNGSTWVFEYTLNNSSFTSEQWAAITSGITEIKVSSYDTHIGSKTNPHGVTKAQVGLGNVENTALSTWKGSTNITTLGTIATGIWQGAKIANDYLVNPFITIGTNKVSLGRTITELAGITSISLEGSNSSLVYDADYGAWRLTGNLVVEGFLSTGAKGSTSSGESSYTQWEWDEIKSLTQSEIGALASAYSVKEAFNELNTAIEALAGKATNVTFAQTLTSGKQIGSISIDGKSTSLFAPANYAWSEVTGKPTFATVATSGSYSDLTNKPTIASLMGIAAIGGTSSFIYWSGSTFVSKALGNNAFTNISKVSQLTNDSGYISGITKAMVEAVLTGDVNSHTHSQYLTTHQTIYALTIQKNGTTVGTYTPNSQAATINIGDVASAATLSGHTTNTTAHITADERTLWNKIAGLFDIDADGDVYVKNGKGFYSEGFISTGAKGSGSGSGSSYTQWEWDEIKLLTQSEIGALASAYSVKEAYNELNTAIETLAGKATNVTFAQTLTSGTKIGTISIDGKSTNIYAPTPPTEISQLTNDSGYITGITKAMVEGVLTGNITSHTHSYLPLSGGTMSNTNVVTNLNADLLDGYHASNLVKFYLSPMSGGAPADSAASWFENTMPAGTGAIVYNVPGSEKTIIAGKSTGAYGHMLQLNYDDNYLRILRYYQGSWKTTDWEKVSAGYADAAGKWSTARTITLTGSVTGSVSIDGSANVSLATTTNHTHTFASLTDKPTTISGYGITDAYTKTQTDTKLSGYLPLSGGTLTGSVTMSGMDTNLIRNIIYTSTSRWARALITLRVDGVDKFNVGAFGEYTVGASSNGIAYGYIGCNSYNGLNLRISATSLSWGDNSILHAGNYNSYAPTLTGTGASGTWGISISGNADTIDGYHADSFTKKLYLGTTDLNSIGDSLLGQQTGWANATPESHYPVQEAGSLISILSAYSSTNQIYGTNSSNRWFARGAGTGLSSRTSWREFAFLDSNVASATKLQNSRTIWGQSFDGTRNVDGYIISTLTDFHLYYNTNKAFLQAGPTGIFLGEGTADTTYLSLHGKYIRLFIGSSEKMRISDSGNVGIGTTSPSYKLHTVGIAYASAGLLSDGYISGAATSTSSDIRLKDNISSITSEMALKWLSMLKPKSWTWNSLAGIKGQSMGFVAQDIEGILPQMIRKRRDNGYLSLDYTQLHALEVSALQSHEKRIEELERENKILKDELNRLKLYAN